MLFRPAAESDLDAIERHYTELLTHEAETGRSTTNWSLGVYPIRQTAAAALAAGTLWVLEREGEPVASVILNHHQDDFYATIGWQYPAPPEQVLVVHTLCIPPRYAGQGLGRECVSRIKQLAAAMGCAVIRLDTWEHNVPANRLYPSLGYRYAGVTEFFVVAPRCFFRAKYRRSLFSSNTAARPAPIPRRSAVTENGP